TGVHRRQEVETLLAANLAEDDAVGAHTQRVDDEVADGNRALALEVGRPGFERQPVRLLQPKLGRVFDGDHTLTRVDHLRQGVEHGRLTRTGTTGDDHVHAAGAGDFQHRRHLFRHRAEPTHHVERDRLFGKFTDGDGGSAKRQRRNDDVDAAAVLETGVGQRSGLVDTAADLVDDALGDLEQMFLVTELDFGQLQLALALNKRLVGTIDHDVADRGV